MRILHTSDWHLGRSFGPHSLLDDQVAFLSWLVEVVTDQGVELVVVAGDVYDRAIAPTEALVAFREVLLRLRERGVTVVVITGNHDGPDRVSPYDALVDTSGIHIRGGYHRPGEVLHLQGSDGPLDVVPVPFLDPPLAPDTFHDTPGDTSGDTPGDTPGVRPAAGRTHHSVLARALELARPSLRAQRSVAVAHAFVAGGSTTDSERHLTVGGTGHVDAALFDGFSYAALGHLHRPQHVSRPHVRYSGSPLPYSFSEQHRKSVTLVDLGPDGTADVTTLDVPVGRQVLTVQGTIAELCAHQPDPEAARSFVRAVLTDREVVLDARARLAVTYPYVVEIELRPAGLDAGDTELRPLQVAEIAPLDVARAFWHDASGAEPTAAEDALLAEALEHALAQTGGGAG